MNYQINLMKTNKEVEVEGIKDAKTLIPLYAENTELPIAMVSKSASQHTKNVILAIWKKECNDELSTEII